MLRYSKLSDAQVLANLLTVCDKENVAYSDDGMEAIVFTAQGSHVFIALNSSMVIICYAFYKRLHFM